jgi:hypothetical protein
VPVALHPPAGTVVLTISGPAPLAHQDRKFDFDMAMLERMPQHSILTETPWYGAGAPIQRPAAARRAEDRRAPGSLPAPRGPERLPVEMPFDDAQRYDVVLARQLDGKAMSVREKGPLFVMYPFDSQPQLRNAVYFGRCVWQLRSIELA